MQRFKVQVFCFPSSLYNSGPHTLKLLKSQNRSLRSYTDYTRFSVELQGLVLPDFGIRMSVSRFTSSKLDASTKEEQTHTLFGIRTCAIAWVSPETWIDCSVFLVKLSDASALTPLAFAGFVPRDLALFLETVGHLTLSSTLWAAVRALSTHLHPKSYQTCLGASRA